MEGRNQRLVSPVDKSRQASHSLTQRKRLRDVSLRPWRIVTARISRPGGRAAEGLFGASVAHNNHKIGVNP